MTTRAVRAGALIALVALLAVQFWSLREPYRRHPPPRQQVETRNPKVGFHTRLTGTGDEAYIVRSLSQVREIGASWIVDLFPWAYVQPRSRYGFDWSGADMLIE